MLASPKLQAATSSSSSWRLSEPLPTATPSIALSNKLLQDPFTPNIANARWRLILNQLEKYLDVESLLTLRACASIFRNHKFKPGGQAGTRIIRFSSLRGFDGQLIVERLLRTVLSCLNPNIRSEGVEVDFSHCFCIKDSQLAFLVTTSPHFVPSPQQRDAKSLFTKLTSLRFDFCSQITDKGILALLSAHLPHLASLNLRCIRSQGLNGSAFIEGLTSTLWPKFRRLNVDFTSFSLEALTAVAEFITDRAASKNVKEGPSINTDLPSSTEPPTLAPAHPHTQSTTVPPGLSFTGSWASKCYLEAIGAKHLIKALAVALNSGDPDEVREVSQQAQHEIDQLVLSRINTDPIAPYVVGHGSKLLMNVPVTCPTSEEGGVNVWTLPISVAVLNGQIDVVEALVKAGAELDVIDHLGKSPLVRAVASRNFEMTQYLLGRGVHLTPHSVLGPSALNVAIENRDMRIARVLLEKEYPLNLKCPAIKTFKSPLHVACEVADEALIHSLLDWGANPNTFSGTYKNSPAMLAYKVNAQFLPVFLQGGPGGALKSLPLCSEILTAAIAKDDLRSAELLLSLFPQLMTRQHPTWSCPHIQAAKMGKVEVLDGLLSTYRSSLTSKLNVSPMTSTDGAEHTLLAASFVAAPPIKRFHHPLNCVYHSRDCIHSRHQYRIVQRGVKRRDGTDKYGADHSGGMPPYSRLSSEPFDRQLVLTAVEGHQNSSTRADSTKILRSAPFPQSSPARMPQAPSSNLGLDTDEPVENAGGKSEQRRPSSKLRFWSKKSSGTAADGSYSVKEFTNWKARNGSKTTLEDRSSPILIESSKQSVAPRRLSVKHPQCWVTRMQELLSIKDATTGHTALHYVAEDGHLECLKVLLKYGVVIDLRNTQGQTPLHCACNENRRNVAEFLIVHGSRLNLRDFEKHETPLMACIRMRNAALAFMIVRYMKIRERHGYMETDAENVSTAGDLQQSGGITNEKHQTVIGYAVYFSRFDIVNELFGSETCVQDFLADEEGMRVTCAFVLERMPNIKDTNQQHIMRKVIRLCQKSERRRLVTSQMQLNGSNAASCAVGGECLAVPKGPDTESKRDATITSSQPTGEIPSSSPSLASSKSMNSAYETRDAPLNAAAASSDSSCFCYCMECLDYLGSDYSDFDGFQMRPREGFDEGSPHSSLSSSSRENDEDESSQEDALGSGNRNRSSRLKRARDKMKLAARKPFQLFSKSRSSYVTS